ncbi:hypothetical protein PIB30_047940 [Stylosanthes scabra]|uniref:Uncharacterized protein n=1 Tax=Stylosanthes scabra TaxID=79078 RepID=A0ABU6WK95_9FABA|nr:hypothetical protein [Stylosanthes scabra]
MEWLEGWSPPPLPFIYEACPPPRPMHAAWGSHVEAHLAYAIGEVANSPLPLARWHACRFAVASLQFAVGSGELECKSNFVVGPASSVYSKSIVPPSECVRKRKTIVVSWNSQDTKEIARKELRKMIQESKVGNSSSSGSKLVRNRRAQLHEEFTTVEDALRSQQNQNPVKRQR